MAIPTLLYRSVIWTLTKKDERQIYSSEIKFLKSVKRYGQNKEWSHQKTTWNQANVK